MIYSKLASNRCALLSLLYCIVSSVFSLISDDVSACQTSTNERIFETRVDIFPNSVSNRARIAENLYQFKVIYGQINYFSVH